jgi:A-macroglobulin TED domain/A-macroglobulin receptor binding domain
LKGNISHTLEIPANALPDASKLMVRMYPGAMAQVVDGLDGIMRTPNGCFEQTSSSAYPNVLIVDYIKKNRVASPQMLMKAEQYLNVGYQRLLTFERPGGGFDWWGREDPLIWTSAYGLQQFSDMAKVYPIDRGIIDRTQGFLMNKRDKDGTWSNIGATHGETIASMGNPKLLLTSYVTWSLLESGYDKKQLQVSIDYIRNNIDAAGENGYILALAANALAAFDTKDDSTLKVCQRLDKLRQEDKELKVQFFPAKGTSLTYGRGDSVSVETSALATLAMIKTGQFNASVNQAMAYLVKTKQAGGTWGTTQATILSLKALLAGMGGSDLKDDIFFTIKVNGEVATRGKIGKTDADVMQAFELKGFKVAGANEVQIEVNGETNLMYQIVSRHYEPWQKKPEAEKPAIDVRVEYDRTKLSTKDMLKATATLKYNGKLPTYMVMLDLGIAPGFSVDAGDFAEMVGKNKIKKFEMTARQVILYLGDVRPGDELTFEYVLRPRYPLRAQTPASTAYECNTPGVRAVANPVELVVEEK